MWSRVTSARWRTATGVNKDDTTRTADPRNKAPDAEEIDDSDLSSSEQFDITLCHAVKVIGEVAEA